MNGFTDFFETFVKKSLMRRFTKEMSVSLAETINFGLEHQQLDTTEQTTGINLNYTVVQ